jgi:hypothetical protein
MPKFHLQPIGEKAELPSGYWQKCGNFHPFFLKRRFSVYINKKSIEEWEILISFSGPSPIFVLSFHTTFS